MVCIQWEMVLIMVKWAKKDIFRPKSNNFKFKDLLNFKEKYN
jgi:hypothetical protein